MTLFSTARHNWYKLRLRNPNYAYLFEPPPVDEWVSVDCETTGLDPKKDEIISIGAIKIKGDRVLTSQRFEIMIRPSSAMTEEGILIHRLRARDVAGGIDPQTAAEQFLAFVGSRPLIGYYLEFDLSMLNKLVKPLLGIPLPQPVIEVSGLYYDHKFRKNQDGFIDLSFNKILEDLNIPVRDAHDAFNDALMTALMFIKLKTMYPLKVQKASQVN